MPHFYGLAIGLMTALCEGSVTRTQALRVYACRLYLGLICVFRLLVTSLTSFTWSVQITRSIQSSHIV